MRVLEISVVFSILVLIGMICIQNSFAEGNDTTTSPKNFTVPISDPLSVSDEVKATLDTPNYELGQRINQLNEDVEEIRDEMVSMKGEVGEIKSNVDDARDDSRNNTIIATIIAIIVGGGIAVGLYLKGKSDRKEPDKVIKKQGEKFEEEDTKEKQWREKILDALNSRLNIAKSNVSFIQGLVSDSGDKDEKMIDSQSEVLKGNSDLVYNYLKNESEWIDKRLYDKIDLARDSIFQFSRTIDKRNQKSVEGIKEICYEETIKNIDEAIKAISEYKLPDKK